MKTGNQNPYLSVVIPAYNEEKNLKVGVHESVLSYLNKQKYSWELLLVDDGSTDETGDALEKFAGKSRNIRVLREPHRGKGGTVVAGVLASNGDVILFTDMDQATPIKELEKVLPKIEEGFDIAIGSRSGRKGAPILRKLMAYGFAILRALILRLPYKDTQCGFKIFKREAAQRIFKNMQVFSQKAKFEKAGVTAGFDLELLYLARKMGFSVVEVPVEWQHKGTERVSPIKDSWEGLRDLVKVRLNAILGKYRYE